MNQRNNSRGSNTHHKVEPRSSRSKPLLAALFAGCLIAAGLFVASRFVGEPPEATGAAMPTPTATQLPNALTTTSLVISTNLSADPAPLPVDLSASFDELAAQINGAVGISITPVGRSDAALKLGQPITGPAWSTTKVPVVLAALREQGLVSASMNAAITRSDNAAAEEVWASLGDPATAAAKVEEVLRGAGDQTTVQSQRVRSEFTAFGQTIWPLDAQAAFMSNIVCDPSAGPVLDLMGQVEAGQSWGLGRVPGARFKGGWGPAEGGDYLVRQFGVVPTPNGSVAIAIAVEPSSGSFSDGTQALDTVANWISLHLAELPAGNCPN